ncbi:unannotated protein [freshwater metagenome]|uniref:Unannotated protein n=1 Tax=freshwater metagenome TaxID=449393 RepID=A0A6J7P275_9ZZZZ
MKVTCVPSQPVSRTTGGWSPGVTSERTPAPLNAFGSRETVDASPACGTTIEDGPHRIVSSTRAPTRNHTRPAFGTPTVPTTCAADRLSDLRGTVCHGPSPTFRCATQRRTQRPDATGYSTDTDAVDVPGARTASAAPGTRAGATSDTDSDSSAHAPGAADSCQPAGSPGIGLAAFDPHDRATPAPPEGPAMRADSHEVATCPVTTDTFIASASTNGPAPAPRGATANEPTFPHAPDARCTSTRYSRA